MDSLQVSVSLCSYRVFPVSQGSTKCGGNEENPDKKL